MPPDVRLLVGGMARSGTTVVQRLLSEIDGVWVAPETHFWRYAPELADRYTFPLDRTVAGEALAWFTAQPSVDLLEIDAADVLALLPERSALWDVFVALVRVVSPSGVAVLGEKTPDHLLWAAPLMDAVPSLDVVGVVRDPRAVFRSHQGVPWGVRDLEQFTAKWIRHSCTLRGLEQRYGRRVVAARFEDVAADADGFRAAIGDQFGLGATTDRLPPDATTLFDPGREWWKAEALHDVEPREETWPSALSRSIVETIETVCGPEMAHWGYQPVASPPPAQPAPDAELEIGRTWRQLPIVDVDRGRGQGASQRRHAGRTRRWLHDLAQHLRSRWHGDPGGAAPK